MDSRVAHIVAFIGRNYARHLTLDEMAEMVNLSRWRLCHLFKFHMGTSPERYLAKVRLEKAKELLENEFLTVKEVTHAVGMKDPSHFHRCFKAAFGLPPIQWRDRKKRYEQRKKR